MKISRTSSLVTFLALALSSQSIAANLCASQGYTVGFFNGVWNTQVQAHDGSVALRDLIGTTYNGEPVQYEVFYNETGSTDGATSMQDLAEVFEQRAAEVQRHAHRIQ